MHSCHLCLHPEPWRTVAAGHTVCSPWEYPCHKWQRKRNPEQSCLGLGGSHTPRAPRSRQARTSLRGQNPREYRPGLLLVTRFVKGRVEKSEDVLERGGGHD